MPQRLVNGELVEITEQEHQEAHAFWEFRRDANGNPEGRKVTPDGTVLEDWQAVPEGPVAAQEARQTRDSVDTGTAIGNALNSAPGNEIVSILVAKGVLTVEEAQAAGWSP